MIVFLLLVIIAIMLFGAARVKGAFGTLFMGGCLALIAIAFFSAGWVGALILGVIAFGIFAYIQFPPSSGSSGFYNPSEAEITARMAQNKRDDAAKATAKTIADAKKLDEEFRVKIAAKR